MDREAWKCYFPLNPYRVEKISSVVGRDFFLILWLEHKAKLAGTGEGQPSSQSFRSWGLNSLVSSSLTS